MNDGEFFPYCEARISLPQIRTIKYEIDFRKNEYFRLAFPELIFYREVACYSMSETSSLKVFVENGGSIFPFLLWNVGFDGNVCQPMAKTLSDIDDCISYFWSAPFTGDLRTVVPLVINNHEEFVSVHDWEAKTKWNPNFMDEEFDINKYCNWIKAYSLKHNLPRRCLEAGGRMRL